jgi:hypothetical protein
MSLDFCWLDSDHSMFVQNSVIITVYVDDFLLVEKNKSAIQNIKQCLNDTFKMSDLSSVFYYLDMKVKQNCAECTICLTQTAYINKVLQTFQQLQTVSVNFYEFWCTHEEVYHSGWHHCHLTVSESSQITNVHYVTDMFWHHLHCLYC